jgi:hypothetical protein
VAGGGSEAVSQKESPVFGIYSVVLPEYMPKPGTVKLVLLI